MTATLTKRQALRIALAIAEGNDCHNPAGSPDGGQFCKTGGLPRSSPLYGYGRHLRVVKPDQLQDEPDLATVSGNPDREAAALAMHVAMVKRALVASGKADQRVPDYHSFDANVKAATARRLAQATGLPEELCSKFVASWAGSSWGATTTLAQYDAAQMFGLPFQGRRADRRRIEKAIAEEANAPQVLSRARAAEQHFAEATAAALHAIAAKQDTLPPGLHAYDALNQALVDPGVMRLVVRMSIAQVRARRLGARAEYAINGKAKPGDSELSFTGPASRDTLARAHRWLRSIPGARAADAAVNPELPYRSEDMNFAKKIISGAVKVLSGGNSGGDRIASMLDYDGSLDAETIRSSVPGMLVGSKHRVDTVFRDERLPPVTQVRRQLLRAMYDLTQADLKALGVRELQLSRGVKPGKKERVDSKQRPRRVRIRNSPMSAYSAKPGIASDFSGGGIVTTSRIPANRILSMPGTGFGCHSESEVVVLGDPRGWTVETVRDVARRTRQGIKEGNDCHVPAGNPNGGQFCKTASIPGIPKGIDLQAVVDGGEGILRRKDVSKDVETRQGGVSYDVAGLVVGMDGAELQRGGPTYADPLVKAATAAALAARAGCSEEVAASFIHSWANSSTSTLAAVCQLEVAAMFGLSKGNKTRVAELNAELRKLNGVIIPARPDVVESYRAGYAAIDKFFAGDPTWRDEMRAAIVATRRVGIIDEMPPGAARTRRLGMVEGSVPPASDDFQMRFSLSKAMSQVLRGVTPSMADNVTSGDASPQERSLMAAAWEGAKKWRSAQAAADAGFSDSNGFHPDLLDKGLRRRLLQASYDLTQETLAKAGVTEVIAWRGQAGVASPPGTQVANGPSGPPKAIRHPSNPLASYSLRPRIAEDFSGGVSGMVTVDRIPASRIFSMPGTGFGCLDELEVVVLGHKDTYEYQGVWKWRGNDVREQQARRRRALRVALRLAEGNDCHNPAGTPNGGQFCKTNSGGLSATTLARAAGHKAVLIDPYNKGDYWSAMADIRSWSDDVAGPDGNTQEHAGRRMARAAMRDAQEQMGPGWLVRSGGRVVGVVSVYTGFGEMAVGFLGTAPDAPPGVGLRLMVEVARAAVGDPDIAKNITLDALPGAIPFYRKLGFKRVTEGDPGHQGDHYYMSLGGEALLRLAKALDGVEPSDGVSEAWEPEDGNPDLRCTPKELRRLMAGRKRRVLEGNDCHNPAGTPAGGRFCKTGSGNWRSSSIGLGRLARALSGKPVESLGVSPSLVPGNAKRQEDGVALINRVYTSVTGLPTGPVVVSPSSTMPAGDVSRDMLAVRGANGYEPTTGKAQQDVMRAAAGNIARRTGVKEEFVSEVIRSWLGASSSGLSAMVQVAAADVFGIRSIPRAVTQSATSYAAALKWVAKGFGMGAAAAAVDRGTIKEDLRKVVRAMYDLTQEQLKAAGVTELVLYRGVALYGSNYDRGVATGIQAGQAVRLRNNPLSAYSVSPGQAAAYGRDAWVGATFVERVPASRIFSMPGTGYGWLDQGEIVVLNDAPGWTMGHLAQVNGVGRIEEGNDCHNPAGAPTGGQFCGKGSPGWRSTDVGARALARGVTGAGEDLADVAGNTQRLSYARGLHKKLAEAAVRASGATTPGVDDHRVKVATMRRLAKATGLPENVCSEVVASWAASSWGHTGTLLQKAIADEFGLPLRGRPAKHVRREGLVEQLLVLSDVRAARHLEALKASSAAIATRLTSYKGGPLRDHLLGDPAVVRTVLLAREAELTGLITRSKAMQVQSGRPTIAIGQFRAELRVTRRAIAGNAVAAVAPLALNLVMSATVGMVYRSGVGDSSINKVASRDHAIEPEYAHAAAQELRLAIPVAMPEPRRAGFPRELSTHTARRSFVRAMYNLTQADLAAQGVTEVQLYRGTQGTLKSSGRDMDNPPTRLRIRSNPASAYSFSRGVAERDFSDRGGFATAARIPASRILSFPGSGFGCLNEGEFVVLGEPRGWTIETVTKWGERPPRELKESYMQRSIAAPRSRDRKAALLARWLTILEENPYHEPGGQSNGGQFARRPQGAPIAARSVAHAARLIAAGQAVRLRQPRQVATLLDRLGAMAQDAAARGEKAPKYDLCKVTVRGSNLFCAQNRGVPRVEMPQFKGLARPGSKADKLPKNKDGEVDAVEVFKAHLLSLGFKVTPGTERAEYLRASQTELVGVKVAGMMNSKTYDPGADPVLTSRDGYLADGHHRWAAVVGRDARDGHLGDVSMRTLQIDMDIDQLLPFMMGWVKDFGILPKDGPG